MRDYRDIASRREAARSLPKAWSQLVEEPEDLLVELLSDQTEAISGYRPSTDEVTAFLRSLVFSKDEVATKSIQTTDRRRALADNLTSHIKSKGDSAHTPTKGRAVEYHLFGQRQFAPNASMALIGILTAIAKRHPNKMDEVADAVRGRTRNHIARTVAEIYPTRPDLARAVEFTPGWLVGLNIANRGKIRIIRETCRVTGVEFGKDVVIDLPNADA